MGQRESGTGSYWFILQGSQPVPRDSVSSEELVSGVDAGVVVFASINIMVLIF